MDNIKVSVVMLSYNHGKYIEKAIRSAVEQNTKFKFEIIVGDDASPDDSQEKIKLMYNKYPDIVKPVLREKNLGAMKNMIDLIMRTQGEYIAFLEGDDFWISRDKLQKQVDFLDNHNGYVACCHKNSVVDESDNIISKIDRTHCNHEEYTINDFSNFILPGQTATFMIRRKVFFDIFSKVKILLKKNMLFVPGDRILALYLLSQGKIFCSDEILSSYRYIVKENGTNWSSKYGTDSAFVHFYYINVRRKLKKLGKLLGIQVDFKAIELMVFKRSCRRFLKRKNLGDLFNIIYMLLFSRYRIPFFYYVIKKLVAKLKLC